VTPQTRNLLDEIYELIPDELVREVSMFGAVAIMIDNAMVVAVNKDGSLLVRVDAGDDALLLQEPDASRAEMGQGREMGVGWLRIDSDTHGPRLEYWINAALRRRT
jgi:TfoX/Sxy family transcriptional regulator of competence genes